MFRIMKKLFPKDLEFELEEEGTSVKFLHARVYWNNAELCVAPEQPNFLYALGESPWPKISRCCPFISSTESPKQCLNHFIAPQLAAHWQICKRFPRRAIASWCLVLLEVRNLKWPGKIIINLVFRNFRRKDSRLLRVCRELTIIAFRWQQWSWIEERAREYLAIL